ncbi:hypothetical protein M0534_06635 [Methylonatrum kenyense]|uniref:hypothetical protein n=1 Tax=Methylonatrum kenyense TaxID=455253 RepID=UPI0020C000EC|nr:hypothetical protein [Methylonatrum kenyense]MCK8516001.1 hypothetical protein [Methylonatrum kenyense]
MRLIVYGILLMLLSLSLLMAMVTPLLPPSLGLSLLAYGGCLTGFLLALAGALSRLR